MDRNDRLKFPTRKRLDDLVEDFGDWAAQLEKGLGLAEWSFKRIVEIASGIMREFAELLFKEDDEKLKKEYGKYLAWMSNILLMANKLLEKEK